MRLFDDKELPKDLRGRNPKVDVEEFLEMVDEFYDETDELIEKTPLITLKRKLDDEQPNILL